MDIYQIKIEIDKKLKKQHVTSKVLLGRARFLEDSSQKTSAFNDPLYFPFYYHLGSLVRADSLAILGINLALPVACFAQGCREIKHVLGLQYMDPEAKIHYSPRFARANIRDRLKKASVCIHIGVATDQEFLDEVHSCKWDMVLIDEEGSYDYLSTHLNLMWENMKLGGYLVMDYLDRSPISRQVFDDFAKVSNRSPVFFKTRYGVGIVQK